MEQKEAGIRVRKVCLKKGLREKGLKRGLKMGFKGEGIEKGV